MKATGIVRKIDELGRFVIPKEVRRFFGINVGDPMEVFIDNEGHIMLKKYDPLPDTTNHIEVLRGIIAKQSNYTPEVANKAISLLNELEELLKKT